MPHHRYLFLAAVENYRDKGWLRLPGVAKDARRLRAVLEEHADGGVHRTVPLFDGAATKTAILDKIREIGKEAGETDQVIVYLGGHGGRRRDDSGTRWRHFFVPYDGSSGPASRDILYADELAAALRTVRAGELVVIFDFCHAGGMPGVDWVEDLDEVLEGWKSRFTMAAARGLEEAVEHGQGGFFIQALCDALAGKGVIADEDGRISAQKAWAHAADVGSAEAKRHGRAQTAVAAGAGGPIYLTRISRKSPRVAGRFIETYPRSQDPAFFDDVKKLIGRSHRIVLIGTGLNVLWEQPILDLLVERAHAAGVHIEICLGNPYNPSVQNRLIEEAMRGHNPPLGARGMEKNLKNFVDRREQLRRRRAAGVMRVSLFEHYPTFATLMFDREIFVYPYGYHVLGTTSPLLHFHDDDGEDARFFRDNAQLILDDAVPVETIFRARQDRKHFDREWTAAAVYVLPEQGSDLYRFGTGILGYDIHSGRKVAARACPVPGLRSVVGEAAEYGFHATLADALYFATPAGLERVKAELRFLADEFAPFDLDRFEAVHPFQKDEAVIALQCRDASGSAEALHHELVSRVYPLAVSSTYRARRTRKRRALRRNPRARRMIERYGAPFILGEFDPHFTLCAGLDAPDRARQELLQDVRRALAERVTSTRMHVRELYLVVRKPAATRWTIAAKFQLGGRATR